ncbi:hypothetical protein TIFTF001_027729 [Ficus carica]|uniref:DUF8039 domain-containing protein n=1 Tax=Ficus carica TaxID=3494 RepID=A0AA88DNQ9_FICCA|nr:hypothetical protein TIFTF001_027729 [Ficus carica]
MRGMNYRVGLGVLAQEHIPIWIAEFRSADLVPRKERTFVKDHIDEKSVWERPPKVMKNYPSISQDDWERFITYRCSLEFKKLSEQGCELRKRSKYGSTGGRDGYRKRDQKLFELTGEWQARHSLWLDMLVKPGREYKNPSFWIVSDMIGEFSEQQTQGSFEYVGTNDILTKSLSNDEIRVGPVVNLIKRHQEIYAKHGINRETIAEENTVLTVDQHNSFKASCTQNEKEPEGSDPQPTPNASKECQLFLNDTINGGDVLVAIGRAYIDCVLTNTVHGIPLGEENVRVTITVPKLKRALLPILTNEATIVEEAVSGFVAWPKRLIIIETSLSQASRGPSHVPDQEVEGSKCIKKRTRKKKL